MAKTCLLAEDGSEVVQRKFKAFADGFLTGGGIGWLDARLVAIPEAEPITGLFHQR